MSDTILTDKTLESESQEDKNKNENEKVESRKEEKEKENKNENEDEDEDENKNEDDDYENEDEEKKWVKMKKNEIIKNLSDNLDEIIDKLKSFEEQIKSLKKLKDLKGY